MYMQRRYKEPRWVENRNAIYTKIRGPKNVASCLWMTSKPLRVSAKRGLLAKNVASRLLAVQRMLFPRLGICFMKD